jgi:prepilin-type N-terminal cleavage/methylation domain-containing protein
VARAGGDSFGGAEVDEGLGVGLKSATLEVMNLASRRAFTLIELMIVVAIIGLLAALAIPNFMKFQARSRQAEVRSGLRAVFTAEKSYYGNQQTYYDEFDVIGFEPEGGNRYQYFLGGGGLETRACGVAPVCAAGASAICVNGPRGCGTIQSDQKWTNCGPQAVTARFGGGDAGAGSGLGCSSRGRPGPQASTRPPSPAFDTASDLLRVEPFAALSADSIRRPMSRVAG